MLNRIDEFFFNLQASYFENQQRWNIVKRACYFLLLMVYELMVEFE